MTIQRVRVHWTGFTGAPGVNTLFYGPGADPAPDLHTFFNAIAAFMPTAVTTSYDFEGDTLDEATGALTGTWSGTTGAAVTGTGTATYAGPVGACIDLRTSTIVGKRRLQGRMFLVPLSSDSFQADGTIGGTVLGALQSAAAALLGSASGAEWKVWHRPKPGQNGSAAAVTSVIVPDLAAVLRSRRA